MIKILIVEDVELEYEYCRNLILEQVFDATIIHARFGEEALEYLNKSKVDAIFLDVGLPDLNGFELASKIRNTATHHLCPIVFVTGNPEDEDRVMKQYRNYGYVNKPYTREMFSAEVGRLLESISLKSVPVDEDEALGSFVVIHLRGEWAKVFGKDILYVETVDRHLKVVTKKKTYEKINMSLREFIEELGDFFVLQCHKSYGVNLREVARVEKCAVKTCDIYFKGIDRSIPLGLSFKNTVLSILREAK